MFRDFTSFALQRNGVQLHCRMGGQGAPLLLLHGHPQSQAMWHRIVPTLIQHFTVVMMDLRGYGDSDRPLSDPDHCAYSKREMALDAMAVMRHHGFARFQVLAHDRGARVAHRLALDHVDAVERLMLLDIAPTLAMYEQTSEAFARAYWHWFFLIQPARLPERLIEADPSAYLHDIMGRRSAGLGPFHPLAFAEYERCLALVRVGGLIAFDNMLWGGAVARPAQSADTAALQALNTKLQRDERIDHALLTVGDGLALARKR